MAVILKIAIIFVPYSQRHPKEPEPLISHNAQVTMPVWNRFLFFHLFSPSAWIACLHYTTSVKARKGARTGLRRDMHSRPVHIMPSWEAMKGYTTCVFVNWLLGSLQVYKNPEMHKQISRSPVNTHMCSGDGNGLYARLFCSSSEHWWQLRRARRYKYNSGHTINAFSNITEFASTREKHTCRCLNSNGLHLFPRVLWKVQSLALIRIRVYSSVGTFICITAAGGGCWLQLHHNKGQVMVVIWYHWPWRNWKMKLHVDAPLSEMTIMIFPTHKYKWLWNWDEAA